MSDVAPTAEAPVRSFADRVRLERRGGKPPLRSPQESQANPAPPEPPGRHADQVRRERGNNLFLVRGNDSTGRAAWYFVLVDPAKKAAFRKAFSGQVELNVYGRIVASGYGTDPPADVRERMKAEYGFTDE